MLTKVRLYVSILSLVAGITSTYMQRSSSMQRSTLKPMPVRSA